MYIYVSSSSESLIYASALLSVETCEWRSLLHTSLTLIHRHKAAQSLWNNFRTWRVHFHAPALQDHKQKKFSIHLLAHKGRVLEPAHSFSASALYCCEGNIGTSLPERGEVLKVITGYKSDASDRSYPDFKIKVLWILCNLKVKSHETRIIESKGPGQGQWSKSRKSSWKGKLPAGTVKTPPLPALQHMV